MTIIKQYFYAIECDNCKDNSSYYTDAYMVDELSAKDAAMECEWIEHEDKHYCPECYSQGDDDSIKINSKKENHEKRTS